MALFLFLMFVVGMIIYGVQHRRETNSAWQVVAKNLPLQFRPGALFSSPKLTGAHNGCSVLVETFSRDSGDSSTTYTRYRIGYARSLGLGLRLTRQGVFGRIGKFFGAEDIEVGDSDFDKAVVVKGSDPSRVTEFLTPARRVRAARFLNSHQGATIYDDRILWEKSGVERDPQQIAHVIDRMTRLANHMGEDRADNAAIDSAMEARQEGRLDEALDHLAGIEDQHETDARDVDVLKGEILYASGEPEKAAELLKKVSEQEPEDQEVQAFAVLASQGATEQVAQQTDESIEGPGGTTEDDGGIDISTMCETLFDPKNTSPRTTELFEKNYRDRFVRWSGILKSFRSYTYDAVFSDSTGTRAVFEIHTMEEGGYGGRAVQVVVQLPAEAEKVLKSQLNSTLAFEGTLVSCDAFMRNLFVGDGKICGEL
ncbi:tetratricopeptide repeat protein [Candidatus Eisenbacteria bacterium]|uniref:Tetratricopeptide repeat protein n=1 Tax=Eiseniibacteriota bacterium TaxID=2212470 RepID=A0ABV6YIN0_UNCEI